MATFMNNLNSKENDKPKFEGYWKDNPDLNLATFNPNDTKNDRSQGNILKSMDDETAKRATSAGFNAMRTISATLKDFKDNIPESYKKGSDETKPDIDKYGDDIDQFKADNTQWKAENAYPARAKVTVDIAKDKDGNPMTKKDGSPMLSVKADLASGEQFLSFTLNETGKEVRGISARELVGEKGAQHAQFIKQDEIADSNLSANLKAIAKGVIEGDYIKDKPTYEKKEYTGEKRPSAKQTLYKLSEKLREEYGYTKDDEGKWNGDNAMAGVFYNKEEDGHPASVSVVFQQDEAHRTNITYGIRNGDFNARFTELEMGAEGKWVANGDATFINAPETIQFLAVPDEVKNTLTQALGFDSEMYAVCEKLNAEYAKETMPNDKGVDVPTVRAFYHNGNDNIYIKDSVENYGVEIDSNGTATKVEQTADKDGNTKYNRTEVDPSTLSDTYKSAVEAVKGDVDKGKENIERD